MDDARKLEDFAPRPYREAIASAATVKCRHSPCYPDFVEAIPVPLRTASTMSSPDDELAGERRSFPTLTTPMAMVIMSSLLSFTPFHLPLCQLAAGGAAQSGRRGSPLEPAAVLTARVWWISTSPLSNPSADPARYNRHTRARPAPASLTASA